MSDPEKVLSPVRSSARARLTAMAVVATCSTISCFGPFAPCPQVERDIRAMIEADPSATGAVDGTVLLTDSRHDDENSQYPDKFSWTVYFAPTNSADSLVTDVHLHDAATDDVLVLPRIPVSAASIERRNPADPDVFAWIVTSALRVNVNISAPFDLLYELVDNNETYIDVHTVAHPAGARGRVAVTSSGGWGEGDICD